MTMKAELLAEQKEAEALAQKYAIKKPVSLFDINVHGCIILKIFHSFKF